MKTSSVFRPLWVLLLVLLVAACRKGDPVLPPEVEPLPPIIPPTEEPTTQTRVVGFYLLNEGNMNMNKASLDYYDYTTGLYRRNVYGEANPGATLGFGDVGNDLGIYGSKLYGVVNCSNKVEVMDVATTRRLGVIDVKNCRYVTFANGKAYVSAYDGEVQLGGSSPNGFVAEIDTTTLQITRTVRVGRQPEELVVVGEKLYVANSGGYNPRNYERVVTVIDLASFAKTGEIDVAPNLHRLKADPYGDLYVSSRGDHFTVPSKLFVIDTRTDRVKTSFDIACSNLTIVGDTAYVVGSEFSYTTFDWEVSYTRVNVKTEELLSGSFLPLSVSSAIKMPYGIAVDPITRNLFITDAKDYVTPGMLYCLDKEGNLIFEVKTGDIPAHFAFVYETKTP